MLYRQACSHVQERYQAATMSWQHPESSLPPAALTALRKGHAELVQSRLSTWQHAFRGLYLALRHGHCDVFYLSTPAVSPFPHFPPPRPPSKPLSKAGMPLVCTGPPTTHACRHRLLFSSTCSKLHGLLVCHAIIELHLDLLQSRHGAWQNAVR